MAFEYGVRERVVTISDPQLERSLEIEQRPDTEVDGEADGTFRRLWPLALVLSRYLCTHPELVRGRTVVELGGGGGSVSIVCAALGARRVVLTDVREALWLAKANVRRNPLSGCEVGLEPCRWGDEADLRRLEATVEGGRFDVVLACDVVYKQPPEVLEQLIRTQQRLAHPGSLILLAYEFRGSMLEDFAYFDATNDVFDCEAVSLRGFEDDRDPKDDEDYRFLYIYRLRDPAASR